LPNEHILQRLEGIQAVLNGVHHGGGRLTSASKGHERAAFIDSYLSMVFPSPFRFGTGDATDSEGRRSGQLDVVVEFPFAPSLHIGCGSPRLYLAEGIAAVIEIKSDLSGQWDEAVRTANQLHPLRRNFDMREIITVEDAPPPTAEIPLFVVGYTGWSTIETVREKASTPGIWGILNINPGLFVSHQYQIEQTGAWSLWGLISSLHIATTSLLTGWMDPRPYAPSDPRRSVPPPEGGDAVSTDPAPVPD
jgi:hypothetical protein